MFEFFKDFFSGMKLDYKAPWKKKPIPPDTPYTFIVNEWRTDPKKESGYVFAEVSLGKGVPGMPYWKSKYHRWTFINGDRDPHQEYLVKFWDYDWQLQILNHINTIVDAGFDGIHLTNTDVSGLALYRFNAIDDMRKFIKTISMHCTVHYPNFRITTDSTITNQVGIDTNGTKKVVD